MRRDGRSGAHLQGAPVDQLLTVDERDVSRRRRSRLALATLLAVAGALHLAVPEPFVRIVPRVLGHAGFWVGASGVAELASAALLVSPRTSRAGGWLAAATLVAVWPANIQMAVDAGRPHTLFELAVWIRLPLQLPLVTWALAHARASAPGATPR